MSTPLIILIVPVLGAALIYLLITLGVFGTAGRAADDSDDAASRSYGA